MAIKAATLPAIPTRAMRVAMRVMVSAFRSVFAGGKRAIIAMGSTLCRDAALRRPWKPGNSVGE
jgi:hypothetical protein